MAEFVKVIKRREEICDYCTSCKKCPLYNAKTENGVSCNEYLFNYPKEAEKLIMAWEEPIEWDKVEVDAKILVRDNSLDAWQKRYFAKYENQKIYSWTGGTTSWNAHGATHEWKYAKLAEGEENE